MLVWFNTQLLAPGALVSNFRLLDMQGYCIGPAEIMGKNGLVLLVFATDRMKADQQLLRDYQSAYARLQEAGLGVLALSSLNWETLYHLAQRLNLTYPVLFDQCCRQSTALKAAWVPRFVSGRGVFLIKPDYTVQFASKKANPDALLKYLEGSQS